MLHEKKKIFKLERDSIILKSSPIEFNWTFVQLVDCFL